MAEKLQIDDIGGFYAITDLKLAGKEGLLAPAKEILAGGARIIQLRSKGLSTDEMLKAARELGAAARRHGAALIINDRVDIAIMSEADGVHLGQDDISLSEARKILGEDKIIGVSTHNIAEALLALSGGADYISFGPIFTTTTKRNAERPQGLSALKELRSGVNRSTASQPNIVAIGGITELTAPLVIEAGATAVAMISEILFDKDIRTKTASVLRTLRADKRGL